MRLRIEILLRWGGSCRATHTAERDEEKKKSPAVAAAAPCMKQAVAAIETTSRLFSVLTD